MAVGASHIARDCQDYHMQTRELKAPFKREGHLIVQHLVPETLPLEDEFSHEKDGPRIALNQLVRQPFQLVNRVNTERITIICAVAAAID